MNDMRFERVDPSAEGRPIVIIDMWPDDPTRPLDRTPALILLAIGVALGAIWTGFAWTIWAVCF